MALSAGKHLLSLLTLLSFFLLITDARLELDPSDLKALSIIQKDFGFKGQRHPSTTSPCNAPGVFCERRFSKNNTYVLKITRLVFKSQSLRGFLSPAIRRLSELKELSLSNNKLVDQVPPQIVDCRKLEILDLGSNHFSGEVPFELSSLVRLRVLDLSSNKFSGNLSFLKYFPNLETLSIANNLFSGKIPKSLRSFRNLQTFDYSGNSFLEGPAPFMKRVNVSASQYPKRYIYAEDKTRRNSALAPAPAPAAANASSGAQAPAPSTEHHKHKKKNRKLRAWILGFFAGAVAGLISGFVFSLMMKLVWAAIRGGRRDSGPAIFSSLIKKEQLAFLEKEDGLASLEMIGKGGCGEVYKALLPDSDGKIKTIAIKKVIQPLRDATELTDEDSKLLNKKMRQIRSEINTVGQIRHRNLLPLLAHVPRTDCHYLVYEFMKNGSLQDILSQVSEGKRELDWIARHKIALGVAGGLEYLHINHSPRIIHRDLKPANVLLDDDMEARIADFGLAKAMPDTHTHITTSNVAGTVGYIAPEYHQTLKFTDKCDMYSFGVLLGILVMGKLPSDEFFQHTNEMSLVKWMRNIMTSDNPSQAIDSKLRGNGFEEQMLLVLKIACFCTLEDPKQRPNSKDARCMLSQLKH
ncbi:leucine-rich repeat receptor-like serine/threonine/tyrosine-protein kinase SOBIR1 [Tripterygium wilfordii]|uniref:Leucine-rich repeat receptor-like serine/threonine/tyrosine-protein kinase SOBIR1 n=1 Tax=Tripterygium wilfordii TaxID=458696 RepID=A0A7J7C9U2_TRIWF|nr:leucine-rich repeat receptor-like serine/threonine/tyrosine-protein kinase SOBIR1 [Tripterygium wilfordii]KAF5730903.1 leucine-rich repeat receptor-like serine/threonine/tyrosine-protein kinase SOBIR1 [Tripterygium wilfordii]